MKKMGRIIRSKRGQGLIELSLALPILLLLSLGAIEIANMIDARLVLSHLTREGANMTSFGTPADQPGANNDALDAIIDDACPLISDGPPCPLPENQERWVIIYSLVGIGPSADCPSPTAGYIVQQQVTRGGLIPEPTSKIGSECSLADLPNIGTINPGQTFNIVEVFYLYPRITPVGNFGVNLGNLTFYEQAIF